MQSSKDVLSEFGFGGESKPIVKLDAPAGRALRNELVDGTWKPVEIKNLVALFDFKNAAHGWIWFADGQAPKRVLVPIAEPWPVQPNEKYRRGIQVMCVLGKSCAGDGPVVAREIMSTAKATIGGLLNIFVQIRDTNEMQTKGLLPILRLVDWRVVKTPTPQGLTSNYEPRFELVRWTNRIEQLPLVPNPDSASHAGNGATAASDEDDFVHDSIGDFDDSAAPLDDDRPPHDEF
jgi:hypothetical protein